MAKKVFHITKQGKADLEKELKDLIDSRGAVADEIATARENGDLSENAEYTAAREKQTRVEKRISEIEEILDGAQIIESDGNGVISLGDHVVVSLDGKECHLMWLALLRRTQPTTRLATSRHLAKL